VRYTLAGREHEARGRFAVVATPAHVTRKIVEGLPDETARALDGVTYGPFVCGAFLTNETGPMPYDNVYAIAVAGKSFNMFFNHANPVQQPGGARRPGGSLMVYAGAERGHRIIDKSDDEIRDIFLADLYDLFPQTKGIIAETLIQRWPHAIPYTAPGRYRLQDGLEVPLGNVFLAGDYLEYPAMENAAATGREAGKKIKGRLAE
jgi:oxygen-dependent protoporphyrinogen oxidase